MDAWALFDAHWNHLFALWQRCRSFDKVNLFCSAFYSISVCFESTKKAIISVGLVCFCLVTLHTPKKHYKQYACTIWLECFFSSSSFSLWYPRKESQWIQFFSEFYLNEQKKTALLIEKELITIHTTCMHTHTMQCVLKVNLNACHACENWPLPERAILNTITGHKWMVNNAK